MSFNAIRENKILAVIFEFTVSILFYFSVNLKMSSENQRVPTVLTVSGNSPTPALTSGRAAVIKLPPYSVGSV